MMGQQIRHNIDLARVLKAVQADRGDGGVQGRYGSDEGMSYIDCKVNIPQKRAFVHVILAKLCTSSFTLRLT
jgi:hypothetical protein